jgi:hypothetical protein
MRCSLREIAVVTCAVTLIFFCSCERHHPDELGGGEHGKSEKPKHEKAGHADKHGQSAEPARAPISPTPAQFFPESTPH